MKLYILFAGFNTCPDRDGLSPGRHSGAPFTFPLDAGHAGENTIRVDVVVNLGYSGRDHFSTYHALPRSGWIGPATVC